MPRDLPVRAKLLVLVALPVAATVLLASWRVADAAGDGRQVDRERRAVSFAAGTARLAHELQAERDLTAGWLAGGKPAGRTRLRAQRGRVDRAAAAFRAARPGLGLAPGDARLARAVAAASAELGRLPGRRLDADQLPIGAAEALTGYGRALERLRGVQAAVAAAMEHPELQRGMATLLEVAAAKEATSRERGLVAAALAAGGGLGAGDHDRLVAAIAVRDRELARAAASTTGAQRAGLAGTSQGVGRARSLERAALAGRRPAAAAGSEWYAALSAAVEGLRRVEASVAADLVTAGRALAARSRAAVRDAGLLAAVVALLSLGLADALGRSLLAPLGRLERTAVEAATRRLPGLAGRLQRGEPVDADTEAGPVPVASRDEIGRAAAAFDNAQRVAVRIAAEQAALRRGAGETLVRMARRNQRLLDRQLALLDDLERGETDPELLDRFFQLDHLATRMRRNAESLVVLSSSGPARSWRRPVPVADLVRAAVAEVQDYQRVELLPMDDAAVAGEVGIDLVHLLAELLDNATGCSSPGTPVVVAGQAAGAGYLLEVEDRGHGMSDQDLAEANRRLADPPGEDVAPSGTLGFLVVARLAARHGIRVGLRHSQYGGVTALVALPGRLLVERPGGAGQAGWVAGPSAQPYLPLRRQPAQPPAPVSVAGGSLPKRMPLASRTSGEGPPTA
jgi:Nitrate and nitrite sensing/HAMP domain